MFGGVDLGLGDARIASVTQDQRPAGPAAGPIHDRCAHPGTDGAGQDYAQHGVAPGGVGILRGEGNDRFAGDGQNGAFGRHHGGDKRIAAGVKFGLIPDNQLCDFSVHKFRSWMVTARRGGQRTHRAPMTTSAAATTKGTARPDYARRWRFCRAIVRCAATGCTWPAGRCG
jgi:hypothetical protein